MSKRESWISNKKWNFENNLGDIIFGTMKPLLKNHSKVVADIILNWNKIFDSNMAAKAGYKKVTFTDKKNNRFILHINVKNKDFLEVSHATEVIKEQLTIFLGYAGCEAVKVHKIS